MLVRLYLLNLRQRTFWMALAALLIVGFAVHAFVSAIALTEAQETALSVAVWFVRLLLVVFVVLWQAAQLWEIRLSRFDQVILSLPRSRWSLLLQQAVAWYLMDVMIALLAGLLWLGLGAEVLHVVQWSLSFLLELWIVSSLVLFLANLSAQFSIVAGLTLLTYLFLRVLAYAVALAQQQAADEGYGVLLRGIMTAFDHVMPGLHHYATSGLLLDGAAWSLLGWQALQALLFMALLLVAAGYDFVRKEVAS